MLFWYLVHNTEAKAKADSLLKEQSHISDRPKESLASNARSTLLKEFEPQTIELQEVLKYLGLGEDRPLGFEKVPIHSIKTPSLENGKGHLKESSTERWINPSSEPRMSNM